MSFQEPEEYRTCPECGCDMVFYMQPPDYEVGLLGWGAMYTFMWEHELWCTWAWYPKKVIAMEDIVMEEYPLASVDYYVD